MKTGSFQRSYPTTKTVWIVEGYSDQQHCPMYPHEGWSWTEWKSTITDTYKTFEQAREAISHGYLRMVVTHSLQVPRIATQT
ncbi:MAG: hypothetical protein EOO77_10405 [Oxalobacteraceae bacterium]|nr:MAG: hypothetical protein EOO77_10405 [Oxalobacteraceae bacterium]